MILYYIRIYKRIGTSNVRLVYMGLARQFGKTICLPWRYGWLSMNKIPLCLKR